MTRRRYSKKYLDDLHDQYDGEDPRQSSSFKDAPKPGNPEKTDVLFNRPGDAEQHGHVVQSTGTDSSGNVTYHYVRDEEGKVYIDDSKDKK